MKLLENEKYKNTAWKTTNQWADDGGYFGTRLAGWVTCIRASPHRCGEM